MSECNNGFKDAVCVDAGRVYDSCCDRDCLEDLRVYLNATDQQIVNEASTVRAKSVELLTVSVDVEPVTFNRGYYSVDMVFYFSVELEVFPSITTLKNTVTGFSVFNKKVILCGADGNAKTFTSEENVNDFSIITGKGSMPKASVQTIDPIVLSAGLSPVCGCEFGFQNTAVPVSVARATVGEDYLTTVIQDIEITRIPVVTLGLFTVVQLIRNVQMLMPVYDFCIPEKECISTTDNPCELFRRIKFPMDEFFPSSDCCEQDNDTCGACNESQQA